MTGSAVISLFLLLMTGLVLAFCQAQLISLIAQIRRIRRAPVGNVSLLPATGPAALDGTAHGATLTSPFTGVPCVFWNIEIQEYRSTGRSGSWRIILNRSSDAPLLLDDGTGRVQVDPSGATLTLFDRWSTQQRFFGSLNRATLDTLEHLNVKTRTWLGTNRVLRIYERHIRDGERVFVLGTLARVGEQSVLISAPKTPLLLSDRDRATLKQHLSIRVLGLISLPVLLLLLLVAINMFA